ncbi:MAG: helix-turn-helix transcriptional regulator [Deltaproteobacteria bacterium]|nr:helix-turn-helix transcriptional regulator [Deltaproteobacteria bacterium]
MRDLQHRYARELRRRRLDARLSQARLAERISVSTEFVSRMERGIVMPSVPTLVKLCEALRCNPNDLLHVRCDKGESEALASRFAALPPAVADEVLRVAETVMDYATRSTNEPRKRRRTRS